MREHPEPIGALFPLGGPVPSDLIIGRRGEIDEISGRLREGMSTMLAGERRIGKTTVCAAVCERLKSQGALVVEVDVPERPDSRALLQLIIDACSRVSLARTGRAALRFARPTIEKLLTENGVPLDLSALGREPQELPARAVLSLPAEVHFGKLVKRIELDARIPLTSWREPLTERFSRAGLLLEDTPREELLKWSEGRPYATMAAARYTAQSARRTSSDTATKFDVQMGIDEADRHLHDDDA
jgi:hypothetical protein